MIAQGFRSGVGGRVATLMVLGVIAACGASSEDLSGAESEGVEGSKLSPSSSTLNSETHSGDDVGAPSTSSDSSPANPQTATSVTSTVTNSEQSDVASSTPSATGTVAIRPTTTLQSSGSGNSAGPATSSPATSSPATSSPAASSPVTSAPATTTPVSTTTPAVSNPSPGGSSDQTNEYTQLLEDFESYAGSDSVPPTWFRYGTAGGGVGIASASDPRGRDGQSGENRMLAWGFDSSQSPGYGGVGKEFSTPKNWTDFTGVKFWLFGSGEGGQLQVEIGEDKTSDVERYRSNTFVDNQFGWRLIRIPFTEFAPAGWNPVPGNEILDLVSVENIVIAANSGATVSGVAIDDLSLYRSGAESTTTTTVPQSDTSPPTNLVWSDEFDGTGINSANWRYDIGGWGWGNGELQYYTNRPENARVADGVLIIEAHKENYGDSGYTSARLLSQNLREFKYGRFEAKVKVPAGAGTWPAFWMLGTGLGQPGRTWPDVGEIDILEYVGREPNVVIGALHGPGYSGGGAIDQWSSQSAPLAGTWQVVAVEWNYAGITWFLNGNEFHHVSRDEPPGAWVFDQDFFIILNLAIGGTLGGDVDPNLVFPLRYEIDYVRVYQ